MNAAGRAPGRGSESDYMLLAFPPEDRLFARIATRQIVDVRSNGRPVRSVRGQLRQRYPAADLHRQQRVIVRGRPTEVWFAYRDGRSSSQTGSAKWWDADGTARAEVDDGGRIFASNLAFQALLHLDPHDQHRSRLAAFLSPELCGDLRSLSGWLRSEPQVTSTASVRLGGGRRLDIEYHASNKGDSPARHDVAVRSLTERDLARDQVALMASSLGPIPAALRELVYRGAVRRTLVPGEHLTASVTGEPWAVLVVTGVVRLYVSADGLAPTVLYGHRGSLFGTHLGPVDEIFPLGLETVTPSVVLVLSPASIKQLVEHDPGFARAILTEGQGFLLELVQSFASRSASNLQQRLAREIMLLADLQHSGGLLPVTEQQLADGVGSIRESVGRTIAAFRQRSWLATTRYGVIVLDPDSLRQEGASTPVH
jgi:CRP/FNR family transcriptional regulator